MNVAIAILLAISLAQGNPRVDPSPARRPACRKPDAFASSGSTQSFASSPVVAQAVVTPTYSVFGDCGKLAIITPKEVLTERLRAMITKFNPRLSADQVENMIQWIIRYGEEMVVDPALIAALIARESSFNPDSVSPTGAQGLGQLTAGTAKDMGVVNPLDPEENIRGTCAYLAKLLTLWKGRADQVDCALASYLIGHRVVRENNGAPATDAVKRFLDDIRTNYRLLTQ